jgi:dTMP kinase
MPQPPLSGFFITFEGLDGSGKTTQIHRLAHHLQALHLHHTVTRQPGGTPIGDRIRALLLDSKSAGIAPHAELAMMFADRAQSIQEVIAPALAAAKIVLCDRFTDSTEAYQGGGRQLGSDVVLAMHQLVCRGLQPDLTFLLLPDISAALARARRRNTRVTETTGADESRFEAEHDAFFHRVHDKYREIALREPNRVILIEGNDTIDAVHKLIVQVFSDRMPKK